MAELGFVLAIAVVTLGAAMVLSKDGASLTTSEGGTRVVLALVSIALGWGILRFGGVFGESVRSRALGAIGAAVLGLGTAIASAEARARLLSRAKRPGATLRSAAASAIVPLVIAGAAAAIIALMSLGAEARVTGLPLLLFAWAFGASVGSLLSSAGGPYPLAALATAATTTACSVVGARNLLPPATGPHLTALIALGPLLTVLAAIALAIGIMSVRADPDEIDAPQLRGFAVATIVATLGAIAGSHWWARPAGRGGWLALSAIVGAMASVLVLLLGRYYDDPLHRAGKEIARARRGGPRTRLRVGTRIGAEGGLGVLAVAGLVSFGAFRCAERIGLAEAGALGIALAIATSFGAWGYLDALAATSEGDARTIAHDLLLVALVTVLTARLYGSMAVVLVVAVLVLLALVGGGILERIGAAHGEGEVAAELRRRAAIAPVAAAGVLAAAAAFAALPQ